jgi:hypothetical protein
MRLSIFDVTGREIMPVADGPFQAGVYNYHLSTASLASGVYFVRLTTEQGMNTAKFLITH